MILSKRELIAQQQVLKKVQQAYKKRYGVGSTIILSELVAINLDIAIIEEEEEKRKFRSN